MLEIIGAGLLGGFGGMARAIIGLFKALASKKDFDIYYWMVTCLIAIFIGMFVGAIFSFDYRLSLLAGYAGTDILEGIFKAMKFEKYVVYNPTSK